MFHSLFGTSQFHVLSLILASTAAIEAIVALWAATSRRHWFVRALAGWAAITVLLPIRAYQPALVFAISSPLIIAVIRMTRAPLRDAPARLPFRFSLLDLLLVTAIVALVLTSLLHLIPHLGRVPLSEFIVVTAAQTIIPTLAWAWVANKPSRIYRVAFPASLVAAIAAFYWIRRSIGMEWQITGVLHDGWTGTFDEVRIYTLLLVEFALLLLLGAIGLPRHPASDRSQPSRWRLARPVFVGLSATWAVCLGLIYWQMLGLLPLPATFSAAAPYHYKRLLELSLEARGVRGQSSRHALIAETVTLVKDSNYVPYVPAADAHLDRWNNHFVAPSQHVRDLARTIDAEWGAAAGRGDHDTACELALTNIRLGLMLQRGSTVVEYLIGVAVQGMANERLTTLRADLSPAHARRIIAGWDQALAEQENVEAVIYRDRAMAERAYGWAARLINILDAAGLPAYVYHPSREANHRLQTTVRLLQADLALGMYEHDHGKLPDSLDQLVPNYLSLLPLDAYSQQPLIYRPTRDDFLLYSIGLDRIDNGGSFTNLRTYFARDSFGNLKSGYDYDLDTLIRP